MNKNDNDVRMVLTFERYPGNGVPCDTPGCIFTASGTYSRDDGSRVPLGERSLCYLCYHRISHDRYVPLFTANREEDDERERKHAGKEKRT